MGRKEITAALAVLLVPLGIVCWISIGEIRRTR